jgi:hypothetical protein
MLEAPSPYIPMKKKRTKDTLAYYLIRNVIENINHREKERILQYSDGVY